MLKKISFLLISLPIFLFACVPYPGMRSAVYHPQALTRSSFAPLKGASNAQTQHFFVEAMGQSAATQYANAAENLYNRLMIDAGIMNYQPSSPLKIIFYPNESEFDKKTGQPSGSRGVIYRGSLYTYISPTLDNRLSYEITQLVLTSYIHRPNPDWIWVKNGLAAYEEMKTMQLAGNQQDLFALVRSQMRQNPTPMSQLINMAPPDDESVSSSAWDCEAESMINFMISQAGNSQFGQFLANLQGNEDLSSAIGQAFTGKWTGLTSFYQAWQQRG